MSEALDPYEQLGHHRPLLPSVGAAFVGITETVAGHERSFNRWYEDDHYYAGAMAGPWVLSGGRWVATHELRKTWLPQDSSLLPNVGQGCYLKAYWFAEGHGHDVVRWMRGAFDEIADEPDRFPTSTFDGASPKVLRTNAYSAYQRVAFSLTRRDDPVLPVHALDHPFAGVCADIIALAPGTEVGQIESLVDAALAPDSDELVIGFVREAPGWRAMTAPDDHTEVLVLRFHSEGPGTEGYSAFLGNFHAALAKSGHELVLSASFIPTVHGTDTYVDELRAPSPTEP